jgi:hypothetical protein
MAMVHGINPVAATSGAINPSFVRRVASPERRRQLGVGGGG